MLSRKTIAAALVAAGMLATTAPANAAGVSLNFGAGASQFTLQAGQRWHGERHVLSPREVRGILRANGFRQIRYLDRRGRVYEARATNRRGHRVGIVVSARSGEILSVHRVG